MTTPMVGPLCMSCRHIRPDYTCAAFPDGIPPIIAVEGHDHTTYIFGDQGIRYEPRPAGTPRPVFEDAGLPTWDDENAEPDEPI